jgi:excisionase family DNA binding protein
MTHNTQYNNGPVIADRHLYKLNEAAAMLSLSVVSLRRLIKSGAIRPHRKTRHILISRAEIERFAAA